MSKKLRRSVTFGGESRDSACRYFRAEVPARSVRPRWSSSVSQYVLTPTTPKEIRKDPRIRGWGGPGTAIIPPTTIVTLRLMDDVSPSKWDSDGNITEWFTGKSMAGEITRAREAGQIVLYDIDDDIWHIPEWSPAAKARHSRLPSVRAYDLEVIGDNIRSCDGVIVSTPYLQTIVEGEGFGVPVHLVRPGIDPRDWGPPERKPMARPLKVGWMGSMSHHLPHLRTMQGALDVLPKYGAWFVHLGQIDGDRSDRHLDTLPCPVGHMPWGAWDTVAPMLHKVDIGIIPRVPTEFNEGQSVTSGLQYAAAGVPFLVSPSAEYERLANMGAGKLCRTVNDWRQGLEDLLANQDYRDFEGRQAKAMVEQQFGLRRTGEAYWALFEELIDAR